MTKRGHILIKNIYYMLSYAFCALERAHFESIEKEEFDNIHTLFAAILSKGIGQQLKRGLHREYIYVNETLSTVRGRIDMRGTISNKFAKKQLITCEYDKLSENNLLNQIIKSTALLLIRHQNTSSEYKDELKKELLFFSGVCNINLKDVNWSAIRFQKSNQTYRLLIGICNLIVEGMLITTENGDFKLASFVFEQKMYRLYEKFILEYYRKHYDDQLNADPSEIQWALDGGNDELLPKMKTDIMLSRNSNVLIIDAKFYNQIMQASYDKESVRNAHLYQILAYIKNKEAEFKDKPNEVSGMLLYARTDGTVPKDTEYSILGNRISVCTLDLNQEFIYIAEKLDCIAEKYFSGIAKKA